MRSLSISLIALVTLMPILTISATGVTVEDGAMPPAPAPAPAPATQTTTSNTTTPAPETSLTLNAAPTTPISPLAGSSLGEYKSVSCNSNSAFAVNNCDQCFDGGSVKVGVRLTGLFDNWINNTTSPLTAYRDEQKTPNMVRFGNSTWATTPATEAGIWKYSSDIVWSSATGAKSSFILSPGSKVKFYEAELNAGYTLEKTDKKNGELVGLLRFPVVSRVTNIQTATEGAPSTHYECVAYKLDAPAPVVETPKPVETPPTTPTPPPEKMTKTETGPETLILIAAAFFIAFGLMFTLRKRV